MVVEKDVFDQIKIGDVCWMCYFDKKPLVKLIYAIGKRFHKNEYEILLNNSYLSERDAQIFPFKKDAITYFLKETKKFKDILTEKINQLNNDIINVDTYFDNVYKTSEKSIFKKDTLNEIEMLISIVDDESEESKNFQIAPNNIPQSKYEIGQKVYTVITKEIINIYREKKPIYKIIDDVIIGVIAKFEDENDILLKYETNYSYTNYETPLWFLTKEEAIEYCNNDASTKIKEIQDRIDSIEILI